MLITAHTTGSSGARIFNQELGESERGRRTSAARQKMGQGDKGSAGAEVKRGLAMVVRVARRPEPEVWTGYGAASPRRGWGGVAGNLIIGERSRAKTMGTKPLKDSIAVIAPDTLRAARQTVDDDEVEVVVCIDIGDHKLEMSQVPVRSIPRLGGRMARAAGRLNEGAGGRLNPGYAPALRTEDKPNVQPINFRSEWQRVRGNSQRCRSGRGPRCGWDCAERKDPGPQCGGSEGAQTSPTPAHKAPQHARCSQNVSRYWHAKTWDEREAHCVAPDLLDPISEYSQVALSRRQEGCQHRARFAQTIIFMIVFAAEANYARYCESAAGPREPAHVRLQRVA